MPTEHTLVSVELTDVFPSPLVPTTATKLPPNVAPLGRSEMVGAVGVACATLKLCGVPSAAMCLDVAAVCAVRVQVPRRCR